MDKQRLIQNIHVSLRSLNGGAGQWQYVRRGLAKMDLQELREFNQLILSIQSTQSAKAQRARHQPFRRG